MRLEDVLGGRFALPRDAPMTVRKTGAGKATPPSRITPLFPHHPGSRLRLARDDGVEVLLLCRHIHCVEQVLHAIRAA